MSDSSEEEEQINYDENFSSDDSEEEILASEDEDDDEYDERFNRFKIELQKDEMASDLEDEDKDDDALPNAQAWGKNKKAYYHTDYIDKDFRSQKLKDADLAKYEEEEAMQIQKRFLNSISEHDLGMDLLFRNDVDQKSSVKTSAKEKQDNEQLMSKSKKIDIIKQESPELNLLINDFNKYSNEIVNELHPLLDGLEKNNASSSSGLKYLKLRFRILYYYCTNISFYMSLKCSPDRQFIKEHPIIKNLFTFKKLICELDSCLQQNEKFLNELKFARNLIAKNAKLKFTETQISEIKFDSDLINKDFDALDQEEILSENNEENDLDKDEKRAITYEMEKNKGLTPKRKRENRNPRVKYRRKFHKAVIRRKGQVREPRKELQKYGGEVTGINVHAVKSVKFN